MKNLLKALKERHKIVVEEDRKVDLETMIKNTETLMKFWSEIKGVKAEDGKKRSSKKRRSSKKDSGCGCSTTNTTTKKK